VSEAIALQPDDLDLQSAMLRADANGPKERLVSVPDSALTALRDYLEHGRPLLLRPRKQPRLFVNQHGNGLTRQGIYQIVQGHARTAGVKVTKSTPYLFFAVLGLLPWVLASNRSSGQGCRMCGRGSHRSARRDIRFQAT
jgi:site-specific recombinase XerD